MKEKIKKTFQNPAVKRSLHSMRPTKSVWGFIGVLMFFIFPEIVAFIWGDEIVAYARLGIATSPSFYYDALMFLFEDGGSWFNLAVGVALLIWLFF